MLKKLERSGDYDGLIARGKVLVDFFATWCGPCRMLMPVLEDLAKEKGDLTIVEIDVDKFQDLAGRYGVQSIPTLILFENGKEIDHSVGYLPLPRLRKFVE